MEIFSIRTPSYEAKMDCLSLQEKAFFSLLYNHTSPIKQITNGSVVYILQNNKITPVQFFTRLNLQLMKLRYECPYKDIK